MERPSKPAKPFPAKKQPGDYDPYAPMTERTKAIHEAIYRQAYPANQPVEVSDVILRRYFGGSLDKFQPAK